MLCTKIPKLIFSEEARYLHAVKLLRRATALPPRRGNYFDETEKVQHRVYRSLRLWSLYADVEESMGTVESTKAIYERMIDLRIATPQIIINYAMFLEENKYFEDAFKVNFYFYPLKHFCALF